MYLFDFIIIIINFIIIIIITIIIIMKLIQIRYIFIDFIDQYFDIIMIWHFEFNHFFFIIVNIFNIIVYFLTSIFSLMVDLDYQINYL